MMRASDHLPKGYVMVGIGVARAGDIYWDARLEAWLPVTNGSEQSGLSAQEFAGLARRENQ